MTKKIFKGILFTAFLTMLACMTFIIGVQYQIYSDSQLQSLKSKAELISQSIENGTEIQSFDGCEERITLISPDGTVIYDNKLDSGSLENHALRSEIKDALNTGSGSSVRYSDTLSQSNSYYALKLSDGNILRISENGITVFSVILQLLPPICAIIIFTSVLALFLAYFVTQNILKPINAIDPQNPKIESGYEEIEPLITRLRFQKNKINRQIAELTRSQKEFEIISDNMSEGMLLTDKNGTILTHNKSITSIFGTLDIDGKNLLVLNRSRAFREVFDGIIEAKHTETLFKTDEKCYEITESPVIDENSMSCGAVIFIIDITEKQERERLRREFTANVSHELKTPLTSILGFSELIKNGIADPEDAKDFGADIHRETKRLISLVNDIIKLSRLDEGAFMTASESLNLKNTVNEITEKLRPIAEQKNVEITAEGIDTEIQAPEALVFEMLYNLCDNAIKYNKVGGSVTVTVGTRNHRPFVTIKDTGIGIAPEHRDRIFERFYTVDKSRSKNGGGTGLGLSIVKHSASALGADITLESVLNKGTEITVRFPQ
ncbi:MAG: PAS domain S-box protein [Clostridia bacterium]|nr:PAS domain S-box protein [Clostridia bacterium]